VLPLLMLGGLFLCYEGCEKLAHRFLHRPAEDQAERETLVRAMADPNVDLVALEKQKIKGAVRTDFILSAEIIVIALGIVAGAAFGTRVAVLVTIAILMTIGVYGLVAAIVKLDDLGLHLSQKDGSKLASATGRGILRMAPWLMKGLSIAGTAAMFLVGGGILVHGIGPLEHWAHALAEGLGGALGFLAPVLFNAIVGIAAGAVVLLVVNFVRRLRTPRPAA
jgi:predicted DNA repair protein MutK